VDDLFIYADEATDYLKSALEKVTRIMELTRGVDPDELSPEARAEIRKLAIDASSNADDAGTALEEVKTSYHLT
jgi:hypothetical protein